MNVYVLGIISFVVGFLIGQAIIAYLLRHKTKEQLLKDESIREYGLIPWGCAIVVCCGAIWLGKMIGVVTP
ncbi:MAG: hypothetical protein CMH30_03885 [Micavibrio sp.]|nr:hypothetical protein [Micavibrio sp.]